MSFLPDNLTTSLIFEKQGEDVNSISLLFKVLSTQLTKYSSPIFFLFVYQLKLKSEGYWILKLHIPFV